MVSDRWIRKDGFSFDDFQINVFEEGAVALLPDIERVPTLKQNQHAHSTIELTEREASQL